MRYTEPPWSSALCFTQSTVGPLSWGVMKIIMRHFAAEADQGRGQSAALLQLLGWMGLSQFSWALLPTLAAGQAGDGLELGAHSLVRKKQCMVVGRDQMEDPMLGAAQFTTHRTSHRDGDGEGPFLNGGI